MISCAGRCMMLLQQLCQRAAVKAIDIDAHTGVLMMIEDRDELQVRRRPAILLRLPAPLLHLITRPVELFQAVLAAEEVACDDDEYGTGTAQGLFHG